MYEKVVAYPRLIGVRILKESKYTLKEIGGQMMNQYKGQEHGKRVITQVSSLYLTTSVYCTWNLKHHVRSDQHRFWTCSWCLQHLSGV
jgi:hypothetical protein